MAKISPFKAVRPNRDVVRDVAAFPYDVVNSDEARVIAADNPVSFLHISKAEIDLAEGTPFYDNSVYEKAKSNLRGFLQKGILFQDPKPFFYIYAQKMGNHRQFGLVAGVDEAEFEAGNVKKHELTLHEKQADRTKHFEVVNAQTGPIFLTYIARPSIDKIVHEIIKKTPEYDFETEDGIGHTIWVISDDSCIDAIREEFSKVDSLYIADGHHRAASAQDVAKRKKQANKRHTGAENYNLVMSVIFPHNQLSIMDYNRAVKDLHGLTPEMYLKKVGECFEIIPDFTDKSPKELHTFGMYLNGRWYKLVAKPGCISKDDIISALDVSILQNCLLNPILGIGDPRQDKRIKFIGGMRGMEELERLVNSGDCAVAFSMYPPTVEQMVQVADSGAIMPPKSTWFEPKLRSGLFVHLYE